jgi:plasmid stabilization system protein ParE
VFKIEWLKSVAELFNQELPTRDQLEILKRLALLAQFPDMYPLRRSGRFRGHRSFVAGNYLVFYKHIGDTVWVRGLWPARIP